MCSDTELQATIAMIRNNNRPKKKLNNFELAATYLLPYDLVAKRKSSKGGGNTNAAIASTTSVASSSSASSKSSIVKTRVHLRWCKKEEFKKFSKSQKHEIFDWRNSNNKKNEPSKKRKIMNIY